MTIAERIKELRKRRKYTQKELAELMSVKPATISGWELARNEPSIDSIKKLTKIFEVSTDYLIGNEVGNSLDPAATDLDEMLDNASSYKSNVIDNRDREMIKQYLDALFKR